MKVSTTHVQSSNINRVGYHGNKLYVAFHSGECYLYANVPYWTYLQMVSADSLGVFFHRHIKGHYHYEHLKEDPFDAPAKTVTDLKL